MLLRLRPNTVRRVLLRKTQTSTPLTKGSPTVDIPQENYHPCYSGLQVQGTATSPVAWKLYNILNCTPYFDAYLIINDDRTYVNLFIFLR